MRKRRTNQSNHLPVLVQRLRDIMRAKGWTGKSLARALGMHESGVSQWMRGYSMPAPSRVIELALLLNTDPNWLLGWDLARQNQLVAERKLVAL